MSPQQNEFVDIQMMKASAKEALQHAMVGPTSGGTARQLAPIILEAIIADSIPGIKATFLEKTQIIFIPLPHTLRRTIAGGCSCPWCKSHPHQIPEWDTLAYDARKQASWVVHNPDLMATRFRIQSPEKEAV